MPDINISRQHTLGLPAARKIAYKWAEDCEKKLDMDCTYGEGKAADQVSFKRSGVEGTLSVTATGFDLHAKLASCSAHSKARLKARSKRISMIFWRKAQRPPKKHHRRKKPESMLFQ